jgi:two-component system, NarL family, response regulator NreC
LIKVMVVDDHVLIRKGIILLLEAYSELEIAGEASEGEEAILIANREKPDVILMDISMPHGLDGFTATQKLIKEIPDVKIILLTMHDEEVYLQKAIEINAHGYILKKSQAGELYEAITSVYRGKNYYNVGLPPEQIDKLLLQKGTKHASVLTVREQEIVRFVVLGYTNKQISEKLLISPKTVENHKANIMGKLNLKSKAELIQYGLNNHYVDYRK